MMPDRRDQRRIPHCTFPGKPDTCNVESKVLRLNSPCDPARYEPCELTGFIEPDSPLFRPDPGTKAMPVLSLQNAETTVACSSIGRDNTDLGEPVTVPAGMFQQQVPLSGIPDLTSVDRGRIADLPDNVVEELVNQTVSQIQVALHCTEAQATYLYDEIQDAITSVTTLAISYAQTTLAATCLWINDEVTVSCAPDADGIAADLPGSVTIPSGTYTSSVSKAHANELAELDATSRLVCVWSNDRIELSCPEDASAELSAPPSIIEAGTIKSYTSKADANAIALAAAQQGLLCVWASDALTICCPNNPDGQTFLDTTDTSGNPLACETIPAGQYVSAESKDDANAQRDAYADAALSRCHYCSAEVTSACPTVTIYYSPEQDAFGTTDMDDPCAVSVPVDGSLVSGAGVPPCYCQSPADGGSQAEADACALDFMLSSALCQYRNPQIGSRCGTVADGGQESSNDCTEYSAGIGSGHFTAGDALSAANLALTMSKIPSRYRVDYPLGSGETPATAIARPRSVSCCYASRDVTVKCGPRPSTTAYPVYTPDPSPDYDIPGTPVHGGADDPADVTGARWGLSDASFKTYMSLPAGSVTRCNTYTVSSCVETKVGNHTQATVDAEADAIARGAIVCTWVSAAAIVYCGFTSDPTKYNNIANDGSSTADQYDPLSVGSAGSPVAALKGEYISFNSWSEANALRNSSLSVLTNCFWSNAMVSLLCWDTDSITAWINTPDSTAWNNVPGIVAGTGIVSGGTQVSALSKAGYVPARTSISYMSQAAANEQAKRMAASQLDCFYTNALIALYCTDDKTGWENPGSTAETGTITLGDGKQDGTYLVHESSYGSTAKPVIVERQVYRSYVSQLEANRLAVRAGEGLLLCFYLSPEVVVYCGRYSAAYLASLPVTIPSNSATATTSIVLDGRAEADPGPLTLTFNPCPGAYSGIPVSDRERKPEYLHGDNPTVKWAKGMLMNFNSWEEVCLAAANAGRASASCAYTHVSVWCFCDLIVAGGENNGLHLHIPSNGGNVTVAEGGITSLVGSLDALNKAYLALQSEWTPQYDAAPFTCNGMPKSESKFSSIRISTGATGCGNIWLDSDEAETRQKVCEVGEITVSPGKGMKIEQLAGVSGGELTIKRADYGLSVDLDKLFEAEKLLTAKYAVDCVYSRLTAEAVAESAPPYEPKPFESGIDIKFEFVDGGGGYIGSSTIRFLSQYKCFQRTIITDDVVDITNEADLPEDMKSNEAGSVNVDLDE